MSAVLGLKILRICNEQGTWEHDGNIKKTVFESTSTVFNATNVLWLGILKYFSYLVTILKIGQTMSNWNNIDKLKIITYINVGILAIFSLV